MKTNKKSTSKFIKVVCSKCKNEQNIFDRPSRDVKCLVCDEVLMESRGGKGKIKAKVVGDLE